MTWLFVTLLIVGAAVALLGAIDAYQGRMKPAEEESVWLPSKDSPRGLILALPGTAISLASGLLGIFSA